MSFTQYVHMFISSLVFTMVSETAVLWLLMRYALKDKKTSTALIIFSGLFASFATIGYVWFVFPQIFTWPKGKSYLYSEPFVFLIEALFYKMILKLSTRNALAASFICNVFSYVVGPILRSAGLWFVF